MNVSFLRLNLTISMMMRFPARLDPVSGFAMGITLGRKKGLPADFSPVGSSL